MVDATELPRVSVCIPCRNGERTLPHTLENLLARADYPTELVEVLIGDHGSSDGTRELLEAPRRQRAMLRRIPVEYDGPNRGKVRNALAREASGDILIFIDHDVLASRSFMRAHVAAHQKFSGALVAGRTYGKGPFRRELAPFLEQLDLDDISASAHMLESRAELADLRCFELCQLGQEPEDIRNRVCPTRFFWTCNVSLKRCDFEACGGFDERYLDWGLEDDDLACSFRSRGCPLVFSNQAWGFHVPHPADMGMQVLSWRRNFDHLLSKFPSRELEYFHLAPAAVTSVADQIERSIQMASEIDVTKLVGDLSRALLEPCGRRLGLFMLELAVAEKLRVSDVLIPTLPRQAQVTKVGAMNVWSLVGTKTPFPRKTFDEAVVIVDQLMLLDDMALGLVLLECSRIARRLIVGVGLPGLTSASAAAAERFFQKLSSVRFDDLVVVGEARALATASVN